MARERPMNVVLPSVWRSDGRLYLHDGDDGRHIREERLPSVQFSLCFDSSHRGEQSSGIKNNVSLMATAGELFRDGPAVLGFAFSIFPSRNPFCLSNEGLMQNQRSLHHSWRMLFRGFEFVFFNWLSVRPRKDFLLFGFV